MIEHHLLGVGLIYAEEVGDEFREEARDLVRAPLALELTSLAVDICYVYAVDLAGCACEFGLLHVQCLHFVLEMDILGNLDVYCLDIKSDRVLYTASVFVDCGVIRIRKWLVVVILATHGGKLGDGEKSGTLFEFPEIGGGVIQYFPEVRPEIVALDVGPFGI